MEVLSLAIAVIAGGIVGFIVGVFVYRNNEKIFSPIADRLDVHEDNVQDMIKELKDKVDALKKVS